MRKEKLWKDVYRSNPVYFPSRQHLKNHTRMEKCESDRACRESFERNQLIQTMGNLIPKNELLEQASKATDAIENFIDTRIWRTRQRIHELIIANDSSMKNNYFIANQPLFLYMLLSFGFKWEIQMLKWKKLYHSWERYEEWAFQPGLFWDLEEKSNEPFTYVSESIYQGWFEEGKDFSEIKLSLEYNAKIVIPRVKANMISPWVLDETVFYKKPFWGKNEKESSLPTLLTTID